MRILPLQFLNRPLLKNPSCAKSQEFNSCAFLNNTQDLFFKSSNTSSGEPLRRLKNIKCPYCGVEIMPKKVFNQADREILQCENAKDYARVLRRYSKYMHKTEKEVYRVISKYAKQNPEGSIQDCLALLYDEAIDRLKLEEFCVLDDVDKISLQLSAKNALLVHKKTTNCRRIILKDSEDERFKRKILLSSLEEITPADNEKEIFEKLKRRASYLPTSSDSFNAFVVKYSQRSQEEIARRLLRPSVASIEHIKPDCFGGENDLSNFILASSGANSARSNVPLDEFIERYPLIKKRCQTYINQIIDAIHRGELKKCYTYPYDVKETLFEESKGQIDLDLSKYKYSKEEAQKLSQ